MPVARQIEVTKEFITRAKKRMLVAILAQAILAQGAITHHTALLSRAVSDSCGIVFAATFFHATSRVANCRHSFGLVRGDPLSSTPVSPMAHGETCATSSATGDSGQAPLGVGKFNSHMCAARPLIRTFQRLEAALAVIGEEDSPEKDVLKDFLARAVEQAKVKLVDVRMRSCEKYLQKCTRQLEEAKASVKNCEEEVAKTEARLARL